jgi:hypothetical protein
VNAGVGCKRPSACSPGTLFVIYLNAYDFSGQVISRAVSPWYRQVNISVLLSAVYCEA